MSSILEKNEKFVNLLETFFKEVYMTCLQSLSNFNKLSLLWFLFSRNPKTFFYCLFKLTSSCPSESYFPESFPDFDSISFHGFYSIEKWKVFQSFGDFFQGSIQLSSKKVFTICLQSLSNFNKLSFLMISLFEKSKNSFLNCFFKLTSSCPSKNYLPHFF